MTNPILQDLEEVMRRRDESDTCLGDKSADKYFTWANSASTFFEKHRAAIEQAVRDAERYRWLRSRDKGCQVDTHPWVARGTLETQISHWTGNALDAAVDDAMAEEKGGGYNHDSPPDTDPQSVHREAWYAGMTDGPEPGAD